MYRIYLLLSFVRLFCADHHGGLGMRIIHVTCGYDYEEVVLPRMGTMRVFFTPSMLMVPEGWTKASFMAWAWAAWEEAEAIKATAKGSVVQMDIDDIYYAERVQTHLTAWMCEINEPSAAIV